VFRKKTRKRFAEHLSIRGFRCENVCNRVGDELGHEFAERFLFRYGGNREHVQAGFESAQPSPSSKDFVPSIPLMRPFKA
jgi:hypothetical protein